MDGRAWNSGYQVTVDGWQSSQWAKSIREVTRIFNEHGIQVSHSKVYQIQAQRDDLEAWRPNTRVIRPLPKQAQFKPPAPALLAYTIQLPIHSKLALVCLALAPISIKDSLLSAEQKDCGLSSSSLNTARD
eukprot:COSAG01_NODE_29764_length_630_cov_0.945386_1_plen_130_part_01